jgi:arginyl-tRNA synthetase
MDRRRTIWHAAKAMPGGPVPALCQRVHERCPVLRTEETTRASRLALCALTARTLARGLDLLGIAAPDQL